MRYGEELRVFSKGFKWCFIRTGYPGLRAHFKQGLIQGFAPNLVQMSGNFIQQKDRRGKRLEICKELRVGQDQPDKQSLLFSS